MQLVFKNPRRGGCFYAILQRGLTVTVPFHFWHILEKIGWGFPPRAVQGACRCWWNPASVKNGWGNRKWWNVRWSSPECFRLHQEVYNTASQHFCTSPGTHHSKWPPSSPLPLSLSPSSLLWWSFLVTFGDHFLCFCFLVFILFLFLLEEKNVVQEHCRRGSVSS